MQTYFLPFGTVRTRAEFLPVSASLGEHATDEGGLALMREMLDALVHPTSAFDMDEDVFCLGWELVGMQRGLSSEERRLAMMIVLASLVNLRHGSTCLPLEPTRGLPELLKLLIPEETAQDPRWSVGALMEGIDALLRAEKLRAIVGQPGWYRPLILDSAPGGDVLYHQRLHHYETRLVEVLADRFTNQRASLDVSGERLARYLDIVQGSTSALTGASIRLTSAQQHAVLTALHAPLTIVTGGPGTGKTSIVVTLLRLVCRLGLPIEAVALAAPTGKAANRMQQAITNQLRALGSTREEDDDALLAHLPAPQTLHRLLGYSAHTRRFHHHEHNQLRQRLVIVDEASMIDMFLMANLLAAVAPDAHVVLLGDAEQLPSVDAGAVLRDLASPTPATDQPWASWVEPALDPAEYDLRTAPTSPFTVRLTHSHRMDARDPSGAHILHVAQAIRRGDVAALTGDTEAAIRPREMVFELNYKGVEHVEIDAPADAREVHVVRERLRDFVESWFSLHAEPDETFTGMLERPLTTWDGLAFSEHEAERVRALFEHAQRARVLCLTRVFGTGTRALNEMFLERVRIKQKSHHSEQFLPGVPVMMLRNDYDKDIFNGDQGLIVGVQRDPGTARADDEHALDHMVVFFQGDELRAFPLESLRAHIEPCFAMTVHKSQGSEYRHVAIVLPAEPLPLLTREVLYTGMTRSTTSVTLIGARALLERGVRTPMIRYSRVMERLIPTLGHADTPQSDPHGA